MRKHYMTLCARGNSDIEITHIKKNGEIEVTCEQATNGGFNTLVMALDGRVMETSGFNNSDIAFLRTFVMKNADGIREEAEGVLA